MTWECLGGVGGGAGETKDLSCGDDSTRENDSTSHENDSTRHSRDAREPPMAVPSCSQHGHAKDKGLADQAAYLGWSFPSRLGRDLADLKTFKDANRRPPPSGNLVLGFRVISKTMVRSVENLLAETRSQGHILYRICAYADLATLRRANSSRSI